MNWVGGSRNRNVLQLNNERAKQQQFFERKKLEQMGTEPGQTKKRKLSQDLMALHKVNKANKMFARGKTGVSHSQIRSVDLERFKSCTQRVKDVDLGQTSPNTTLPFKKTINEFQKDRTDLETPHLKAKSNPEFVINHNSLLTGTKCKKQPRPSSSSLFDRNVSKNIMQGDSEPYTVTDHQMSSQFSKKDGIKHSTDISHKSSFTFARPSRQHSHENQSHSQKHDMFVSEDFQATPLQRPVKSSNHGFRNNKATDHYFDSVIDHTGDAKRRMVRDFHYGKSTQVCSSTPNDKSIACKSRDLFKNRLSESILQLSPIPVKRSFRHEKKASYGQKVLSRPLVSPKRSETLEQKHLWENAAYISSLSENSFLDRNLSSDKSKSVRSQHYSGVLDQFRTEFSDNSMFGTEKSVLVTNQTEQIFSTNVDLSRHEVGNDLVLGNSVTPILSSLSRYRKQSMSNSGRSSHSDEHGHLNQPVAECWITDEAQDLVAKPPFTAIDDGFQYKPTKTLLTAALTESRDKTNISYDGPFCQINQGSPGDCRPKMTVIDELVLLEEQDQFPPTSQKNCQDISTAQHLDQERCDSDRIKSNNFEAGIQKADDYVGLVKETMTAKSPGDVTEVRSEDVHTKTAFSQIYDSNSKGIIASNKDLNCNNRNPTCNEMPYTPIEQQKKLENRRIDTLGNRSVHNECKLKGDRASCETVNIGDNPGRQEASKIESSGISPSEWYNSKSDEDPGVPSGRSHSSDSGQLNPSSSSRPNPSGSGRIYTSGVGRPNPSGSGRIHTSGSALKPPVDNSETSIGQLNPVENCSELLPAPLPGSHVKTYSTSVQTSEVSRQDVATSPLQSLSFMCDASTSPVHQITDKHASTSPVSQTSVTNASTSPIVITSDDCRSTCDAGVSPVCWPSSGNVSTQDAAVTCHVSQEDTTLSSVSALSTSPVISEHHPPCVSDTSDSRGINRKVPPVPTLQSLANGTIKYFTSYLSGKK